MSRAPRETIPHHSVEDRQQLPHAPHQRHRLLGLARRQEAAVELFEDWVVAGGDEGAHIQSRSDRCPPAPHLPLATQRTTGVTVEGDDPHQSRKAFGGGRNDPCFRAVSEKPGPRRKRSVVTAIGR